jgi:hypothetical protein
MGFEKGGEDVLPPFSFEAGCSNRDFVQLRCGKVFPVADTHKKKEGS